MLGVTKGTSEAISQIPCRKVQSRRLVGATPHLSQDVRCEEIPEPGCVARLLAELLEALPTGGLGFSAHVKREKAAFDGAQLQQHRNRRRCDVDIS